MNLNLDTMDAEPAADPPVEVTPTEPAAAPSPPIEAAAAAPAAPVTPEPAPVVVEPPKVVPLDTVLAERREWQEKVDAAKAERAAPVAPPPPPVDFMEDPKGYVDQQIQTAVSSGQATAAELQAFREQQQINALLAEADVTQAEFAKAQPDYQAALDHVRATRLAQLRLVDSTVPEAALKQVIAREEVMGLVSAKQHGINPADLVYRYAQTLGYRTPAAAVTPPPVTPITAAAAAPPAAPAADVSAARSLGAGGGGGDSGGEDEESELTSALKARFRR